MDFHFQLDLKNEDADVESSLPSRWRNIISKIVTPPIGIFWDLENVPIPRNKSPRQVVENIRRKLLDKNWEAAFSVVCDVKKEKEEITNELNDSQVDIIHMRGTAKNAIDEKVKSLMRKFVRSHGAPSTLVLLAGDVNYANDLHELRYHHGIHIVVIYPRAFSKSLLGCANQKFPYSDFTENLPDREVMTMTKPVEVKVTSIPEGETQKLKRTLDILASNTGGKTKTIKGNEAVLKFANSYLAERAVRRMDKEKVHGNIIRAKLSSNAEDINQPSTSQATMGLSDESVDEAEGPEGDISLIHQGGHGYNLRTNEKANIATTEEELSTASFPPNVVPQQKRKNNSSGAQKKKKVELSTASFPPNVVPQQKRKSNSSGAQKKKKKKGFQKTRKSRSRTKNQ